MNYNNEQQQSRRITVSMVLNATSLTKSSSESNDSYLKRVTHLHLQGKRIKTIENIDKCTNLKVLYLYDNQIEVIENLDFASNLQYLQVQCNEIKELPELPMANLTKLYLDENEIAYVTGLENCCKLEELHISKQRLPSFTSLQFDPLSLNAMSKTLQVLEISGNGISLLNPFTVLHNLRKLFAANNQVVDLAEIESIICLSKLAEATFLGNPCSNISQYRDYAIGASSDALRVLDDLPVQKHQQVAIRGLMQHRRKLGLAPSNVVIPKVTNKKERFEFTVAPPAPM